MTGGVRPTSDLLELFTILAKVEWSQIPLTPDSVAYELLQKDFKNSLKKGASWESRRKISIEYTQFAYKDWKQTG